MRAFLTRVVSSFKDIAAPTERLFRIEPVGGFEVARDYVVRFVGTTVQTMYVHIDKQLVDLREVFVPRVGNPNREGVINPDLCPDSPYGVGVAQAFRIDGPAH